MKKQVISLALIAMVTLLASCGNKVAETVDTVKDTTTEAVDTVTDTTTEAVDTVTDTVTEETSTGTAK